MTKTSTSTASEPGQDQGPDPDSNSFSVALRLLGRCDRSCAQLRQKLRERGFAPDAIDTAIARCREYNYLNDARYATERARAMMRSGKGVGGRILRDLRQRGIDDDTAQQALLIAEEEFSPDQLLAQELARRFPNFNYHAATTKERRRVVNFFLRRGFSLELIFHELKK